MSAITIIDEERRRLDLSKAELCRRASVSISTYMRLRSGKISSTERTLDRLRNALAIAAQQAAE